MAVAPPTFGDVTIYLAQDPVDFRLGINGLSVLVEATLRFDPFSRNLFCFVNKRRNQIKVLYWQKSGFCRKRPTNHFCCDRVGSANVAVLLDGARSDAWRG